MIKQNRKLVVNSETIKQLSSVELTRAAGGLPSANGSAENVCCSFDLPCQTDSCPTREASCHGSCGLSCRAC